MRKTLVVGALALVGAAAVAGCGSESGAAEPLTKAQRLERERFIAKASAFCNRARVQGERKGAYWFKLKAKYYERKGSLEEFRYVVRQQQVGTVMAPLMLKRIAELRAMKIPPRDEARVERILAGLKHAAETIKENPARYFRGSRYLEEAAEPAAAFGIGDCAVLSVPAGVFHVVSARPGTRLTPRSSK